MMHKGYLCLVLHAHLPYVRHPEEDFFLEENWFYESITETYIPLIKVFENLLTDAIDFKVTMVITPTLASMFQDPLLQSRYVQYLDRLIGLAEKEMDRTGFHPQFHGLALMYYRRLVEAKELFEDRFKKNLITAFKEFQEEGCVEIITSCATHGFLPALSLNQTDVKAQIEIGVDFYQKTFGRPPRGFWLPECGYTDGIDEFLKDAGIQFFFVDSHGLLLGNPPPKFSVYAPVYCPSAVAAFGRDWESSKQVWSSKEGYPGDPYYREYYRDIGYDLDYEYIKPYIHHMGFRINTGFKYYRITGTTDYKEPYVPDLAREKAALHAGNFMFNREKQIEHLSAHMDRKPIIIAPYDAELFGHWWFEGPLWIEFLIRNIVNNSKIIKLITPSEYLYEYPLNEISLPSASTWGYKGYNEFWIEGNNDWIYQHLHLAGARMKQLVEKFSDHISTKKDTRIKRAINQAARELMLAQASDWAFIMKTGTMVEYAHKRTKVHINRFLKLYNDINANKIDQEWLREIESRDNIFSDLNCSRYYVTNGKEYKN